MTPIANQAAKIPHKKQIFPIKDTFSERDLCLKSRRIKTHLSLNIIDPTCRVCNDSSTTNNDKLISPCLCKGTCEFIHESCIKTWISYQKQNNELKPKCEVCNLEYLLRFEIKNQFSVRKTLITLVLAFIIMCSCIALTWLLLFLITAFIDKKIIDLLQLYIYLSVGIGLFMALIVIWCYFKDCKRNWYHQQFYRWTLMNIGGKNK